MNMQTISNDAVVAQYGTHHDGIFIYDGTKKVGFITDLRRNIASNQKTKAAQKKYSTRKTEERREAMPAAVEEMLEFLSNQLSKLGAEVFINISQPNVHLNGHKIYVICDPLTNTYNRLGIQHKEMTACEMAEEIGASYKVQTDSSPKHILVNNLSRDDIVEVIKKLCSK